MCNNESAKKKHARQCVYGLSLRDKGDEKLTKIICDPKSLAFVRKFPFNFLCSFYLTAS